MQDRPGPASIKGNRLLMHGDRHYDYDAFGNLIRERRGRAQQLVTEYRYDSQHRLIGLTRPDGSTATYQYDAFGRRIRKTVDGQSTEFFWQGDHLIAESSPTQHRSFIYEPGTFRPLAMLDGKGPKSACPFYYQLDHLGTPQELTDYSGDIVWSAKYSAYGKVTSQELATEDYLDQPLRFQGQYFDAESGPDDAPTSYEYRNGFLHSRSRGDAQWTYRRNAQGDITEAVDPDGHVTHYHHDAQGRLLSIRYPDSGRHVFVWNDLGQLVEESLPDGGVRKFSYDALGRRITAQDEHGAVTRHAWDAVGRLIQTTSPTGATRAWSYSAYGQVTAERDELGRLTRYEYDDDLHLVSRRINPDGTRLQYRYDHAQLLLTEIENESGEKYRLDYTPTGLIRQETGFDGRRTAYAYDHNGHLLEKTEFGDDGSTLVTAYQRDSAGRLLLKTLPDASTVEYRYDRLGRLTGVDDGQGHPLAFEYDLQDRLVREHQGWGTLRYAYDACGQLSRMRLPDNSKLDYHYAKGGALTAIDLNGALLTRHVYQNGREQQRQQGLLLSEYAYDEQGRLRSHAVGHQRGALYRRDFAYSANGDLEHIADTRHGQRSYQTGRCADVLRVPQRFPAQPFAWRCGVDVPAQCSG
ncbi:RHS repeat protein [Pseudomonas sp. HS6]|nr:RHS repeat protein [Pseudomonas sp. HS6]